MRTTFVSLLTGVLLTAVPSAAWADDIAVQVNQVATDKDGAKVAVVEYQGEEASGRFTVMHGDKVVLEGNLAALPKFEEWGEGKRYFEADFSALKDVGNYRLSIQIGASSAVSETITIADGGVFSVAAPALVEYFKLSRYQDQSDKKVRVYGTDRRVDVRGGWKDAGGDNGKYLSHLSYANFFNPQQAGMVVWAMAKSHDLAGDAFEKAGAREALLNETAWGADFLHRMVSPEGYFYMTVFDRWGTEGAERVVTGYVGRQGIYTEDYQAAYREGAGVSIAALARASMLPMSKDAASAFQPAHYLRTARRAFDHLETNNLRYVDDGKENIIDDYTALLAATELYRATGEAKYLTAARRRADALNARMTPRGWFRSDDDKRVFYHAAEAGLPVVALAEFLGIETDVDRVARTKEVITKSLQWQLEITRSVANPYGYARQAFQLWDYDMMRRHDEVLEGFFMPHANETGYWWQGESARLASLSAAAMLGGRIVASSNTDAFGVSSELGKFAQHQLDWILGRNPYGMSMLYGFGAKNPPHAESAGDMVRGGVSNGITGSDRSPEGRGITFAPGPETENWRWIEQWVPHVAWLLLASSASMNNDTAKTGSN